MAKKSSGSAKRFGARYGRLLRHKVGRIEEQYKKRQECPFCKAKGVKRKAVGIWNCSKCGAEFTGKAYSI